MMKAPPLPRSARQPQRKMFLAILFCARPFFSLKGKDIFLWGSAFQVFRQCGGASIRTRFCQTIFWGFGFGKTSADFPRGGGVWGGIRAGFASGFWRLLF